MNYRMKRIASCLLAGAIVISGTGVGTYGAQTGGVSAVIATGLSSMVLRQQDFPKCFPSV